MVTSLLSEIQSSYSCWPPQEPLRYLTPLILYLINTLYRVYLSFRSKGRKEERKKKLYKKNRKHRQKFTAKTASYELEPPTTIKLVPH